MYVVLVQSTVLTVSSTICSGYILKFRSVGVDFFSIKDSFAVDLCLSIFYRLVWLKYWRAIKHPIILPGNICKFLSIILEASVYWWLRALTLKHYVSHRCEFEPRPAHKLLLAGGQMAFPGNRSFRPFFLWTQKEITSQTDSYLVILSSKTYIFEDRLTKYKSVWLIISFSIELKFILARP